MESLLGPREGKATLYSTGPRLVMIMGFWLCLGIWLGFSFLACSIQFRSERFGVDHFGLWTEASKQQQQKRLVVQSSQPLTASTPLQNQSMFHRQKLLFRLAWWLVVCLIALPPTLAKHRKARWFCSFLLVVVCLACPVRDVVRGIGSALLGRTTVSRFDLIYLLGLCGVVVVMLCLLCYILNL